MAESYQPSAEELERAEALLLPFQADLTEKRAEVSRRLREMGIEGMLVFEAIEGDGADDDPRRDEIRGNLNGHDILIAKGGNGYHLGRIDWKYMHTKQAEAVWAKYADIAKHHPMEDIREARAKLHALPSYNEQQQIAAELLKGIL